jgi:hypothetical protein
MKLYTSFYADLREQGASVLVAHDEALWWALDELEIFFGEDVLNKCANSIRDAAVLLRKQAGDWE